jgi:hypothetical protein
MNGVMICLVGEQPIPNLLPVRARRPAHVTLLYTSTTERHARNLETLLAGECSVVPCQVPPYDIQAAASAIEQLVAQQGWQAAGLLLNLTGGTKLMGFGAYHAAQRLGARALYLQSEGGESVLYEHSFRPEGVRLEARSVLNSLLTIDDYLRVHGLDEYDHKPPKESFEKTVAEALRPNVDEMLCCVRHGALEIDLILRCGNQVAVAEVKSGGVARRKGAIDQLSTATSREFLGTYTKRLLIVDQRPYAGNRALAAARDITVVDLLGASRSGLSAAQREYLIATVRAALGAAR